MIKHIVVKIIAMAVWPFITVAMMAVMVLCWFCIPFMDEDKLDRMNLRKPLLDDEDQGA